MRRILNLLSLLTLSLVSYGQTVNLEVNSYNGTATSYSALKSITLKPGFHIPSGKNVRLFIQSSPNVLNGFTPSQNYIVTRMFRAPVKTADLSKIRSIEDENQRIEYFDGLGRPIQRVEVMASPTFKDIVQHVAYDGFGRETHKFLPYAGKSNNGSFKISAKDSLEHYYKSAGSVPGKLTGWDTHVVKTDYPYANTVFENSPLNRVLEQGSPGEPWQPVANRGIATTTGRTVVSEYGTNSSVSSTRDTVRIWEVTSEGASASGHYATGRLYRTTIKDENWVDTAGRAGTVDEYNDFQDRVVLKRVWETSNKFLDTYYVYDDLGNLRYVLPPGIKGTSFKESSTNFAELIYAYRYDGRRRLVEKKIPGKGWEYLVYNKNDQIVLTQDVLQRGRKEWIFMKYDAFGRLTTTGQYTNTNTTQISRTQMQTLVDNHAGPLWETRSGGDYPATAFPTTGAGITIKPLVVNYYDRYDFTGSTTTGLQATGITKSDKTKTLLTGMKVYREDGSSALLTIHYYDDRARLIQTASQNHLGGTDVVTNSYLFSGEVETSRHVHKASASGAATTLLTTNSYDHVGRPEQTRKKVNSQAEVILSNLEYNQIGQLRRKSLHNETGSGNYMTVIDYDYNERGWSKRIASKELAMTLNYQDGGTVQYNGNISRQQWRHGSDALSTFTYSYDKLNRLTNGTSSGARVMSEVLGYDDMGNIKSLNRDGSTTTYSYLNSGRSNRLDKLTGGFIGSTPVSYTYDVNGNATKDRTGTDFTYNHLNLPKTATRSGVSVSYQYDALGTKLQKYSNVGGIQTTRDYVKGIEYKKENGDPQKLDMIITEEGYLQNSSGNYLFHYNLRDHLGNVRAVIRKGSTETSSTIVQKQDYYPFGKTRAIVTGGINNYLYNGKERQAELGDQLDYGARFYDVEIGRWNVIDPKSEKYENFSPYNYVSNNPIIAVDPDGKEIVFVVGNREYTYRQGNLYANNQLILTVPRTDGKYTFLSNDQQAVLDQYRYIETSGDKVLLGSLKTLVNSKNKHSIIERHPDYNYSTAYAVGPNSENALLEYSNGKGSDSEAFFNFKISRKRGWSDLELVFHEMRHQVDIDKGELPTEISKREQNAVSSQNYVRKKDGTKELDNYSGKYFYSKESLNDSHNKLFEIIKNAMSQSGNTTIYFY